MFCTAAKLGAEILAEILSSWSLVHVSHTGPRPARDGPRVSSGTVAAMRGSSVDDSEGGSGSDDDDVLASLQGDFAEPFMRTSRGEANDARDEEDEEDERLIASTAGLTNRDGASDDDMDDDALAEEALALAGNGGRGNANAEWDDDEDDEDEEDEDEDEDEDETLTNKRKTSKNRSDRYVPAPAPGSGSRALRAYQSGRGRDAPDGGLNGAAQLSLARKTNAGNFTSGALPSWAKPPLQRALASDTVNENDVAAALAANRDLQRSVRKVIEEVEAHLVVNGESVVELRDALRVKKSHASGFGVNNSGNTKDNDPHETYHDVLTQMRPGKYFTPKVFGGGSGESQGANQRSKKESHAEPKNADALRPAWVKIRQNVPVTFRDWKPWSPEDDLKLRRGVHHFTQQARIFSREKMTLSEISGAGTSSLEDLLDKSNGFNGIVADANAIDWSEVVANHLPKRDPIDCKLRWQNCRDPRLEQSAFDDLEDDRLVTAAKKFGERTWVKIAEELNKTNTAFNLSLAPNNQREPRGLRSATQCAGRYQAFLNPKLVKSTWTSDEDSKLKAFVLKRGTGQWAEAALSLPGHTHQQCLHRWTKVLCPGRRKGVWLPEEDDTLRFAVAAHARVFGGGVDRGEVGVLPEAGSGEGETRGCSQATSLAVALVTPSSTAVTHHETSPTEPPLPWSKIAAHVVSRTDVQCRERWTNVLNKKEFAWSEASDNALKATVAKFSTTTRGAGDAETEIETSTAWAQVAREMGSHGSFTDITDKICRNRFIILSRQDAKAKKQAVKVRDKAIAKESKKIEKAEKKEKAKEKAAAAKATAQLGAKRKRGQEKDTNDMDKDTSKDTAQAVVPVGKRRG